MSSVDEYGINIHVSSGAKSYGVPAAPKKSPVCTAVSKKSQNYNTTAGAAKKSTGFKPHIFDPVWSS